MQLHELRAPFGSHKRRKIVGRGPGSGHGKTSCRGQKGQNCRSGRGILRSLEGGQMPMIKRLPKVGFRPKRSTIYQIVKLVSLTQFKENTIVNAEFLRTHGLIGSVNLPYKVLGDGEIKKPFIVHAHSFSKSAQEKISKAGGKTEVIKKAEVAAIKKANPKEATSKKAEKPTVEA